MRSAIFLAGALIAHAINPSVKLPPLAFMFLCFMLGNFIATDFMDFKRSHRD